MCLTPAVAGTAAVGAVLLLLTSSLEIAAVVRVCQLLRAQVVEHVAKVAPIPGDTQPSAEQQAVRYASDTGQAACKTQQPVAAVTGIDNTQQNSRLFL